MTTGVQLQRELRFDEYTPHHHAHVTASGDHASMFYTIDRHRWIGVSRLLEPVLAGRDLAPITVVAINLDRESERSVNVREFQNTDDGWDEANAFVRELLIVVGLLDRADTTVDHYIAASRAVLHETRKRTNPEGKAA